MATAIVSHKVAPERPAETLLKKSPRRPETTARATPSRWSQADATVADFCSAPWPVFTPPLTIRVSQVKLCPRGLVACYPRQRVEALAEEDPATAIEIRTQIFEALGRLQEQMLVAGTITAQEKVREFLAYFHNRLSTGKDDVLALPMSRYDIADMLGISAETVCRAFTDLQERGVISLQGPRRIRINQRRGDQNA